MRKTFIILLVLFSGIIQSQVSTTSLIAYYPFSGNANDMSGNNLNGTVFGATLAPDRFGFANNAYSFNGTSDYIQVLNSPLLQIECWSMSAWFKTSGPLTGTGRITTKSPSSGGTNYLTIMMGGPDTIVGSAWNGSSAIQCPDNNKTNNNVWHHVVYIRDNVVNKYYIYVDNVLKSTINDSFGSLSNTANLLIGCSQIFNQYWFGLIDDLRIYGRVLNASEVTALYNDATGINELASETNINVYPNPTSGNLTIKKINKDDLKIKVLNPLGQLMIYHYMDEDEINLDLSGYKSGIYFVQVMNEEEKVLGVRKIIKE